MNLILKYFTAVIGTAAIGVIATALVKDEKVSNIVKVISGILILIVLLRPIASLDLEDLGVNLKQNIEEQFQTDEYEKVFQEKLKTQVKKLTEEYVTNKALSMGASVSVSVEIQGEEYPTPQAISISGKLSPDQQEILRVYIAEELGIPSERQRWEIYE